MASEKKMKPLDEEIKRLDAEIARLQAERAGILRARELLLGENESASQKPRRRAANVKPMILDIMQNAGPAGATSAEVSNLVKEKVPNVAKDTVGSVLSRLKADGALVYDGERYFVAKHAPKDPDDPFGLNRLHAVS